jgi:hypothetical protein
MPPKENQAEPHHQPAARVLPEERGGAAEAFLSETFQNWATRLLFGYFGLRLVFFALTVASSVPPDELSHAGLCQVFSRAWLLPVDGPGTYQFGLVTHTPWLYYWVMGKLLHLNFLGIPDLVFLRLLNIPLALATVWYAQRLLRLLTCDPLPRLLLLAVMTNTAMFSLLSASVSYDNLANLLATMAVYYTCAFFKFRSLNLLALALLCQMAGCLTKNTLLPLVFALDLLLAGYAVLQWRSFPALFREYLAGKGRAWCQLLLILAALGLNMQLYGGNLRQFGTLSPSLENVVSTENALQNRIGAREKIFFLYLSEQISYLDALQMTGNIASPGDKADTFYLLMNYQNLKANPALWLGPFEYTKLWFQNMVGTSVGIKAHLPMFKSPPLLIPVYLVLALALAGFLARWRPRDAGWLPAALAACAFFYAGFLLVKINYPAYGYYGTTGIALQGRYLFPVLAPACAVGCTYLLRLVRSGAPRMVLAGSVALIFLAYDFPWFLAHATAQWYHWLPQ